jgi:hypothetical protein
MPVQFACECGKPLRVADELAGRKVRCPDCGALPTVPGTAPPPGGRPRAVTCPECDGAVPVPIDFTARRLRCPGCQALVEIPGPSAREEGYDIEGGPDPELLEPEHPPRPLPRPPTYRKRGRRRTDGGGGRWQLPRIVLSPGVITGGLMVLGGLALIVAFREYGAFSVRVAFLIVFGAVILIRSLAGYEED